MQVRPCAESACRITHQVSALLQDGVLDLVEILVQVVCSLLGLLAILGDMCDGCSEPLLKTSQSSL